MKSRKPPVQTWEMMQAIKGAVGMSAMQRVLSVGHTQINRYCRNPEFTADSERDPLRRLRLLFEAAVEQGARDVVQVCIDYLAEVVDGCVRPVEWAPPDQPTLEAEANDDYPRVVAFHTLCRATSPVLHPRLVREARAALECELDQTQCAHQLAWNREQNVNNK